MIDNESLLPEAEVQRKAQNFLIMKYPGSSVTFGSNQLVTKEGIPAFQLSGTIDMKSRSDFDRLIFRDHPNRYSFSIELDARQGTILNYELR